MQQDINETALHQFIKECEQEFKEYCGIETFPQYQIVTKEMTLEKAQNEGFDALAAAFYDVNTGGHRLDIWSKAADPNLNMKYLVFHELTHILDTETFSQRDKSKNVALKGYTEYHAAQNDFMKLLEVTHIADDVSFDMNKIFVTAEGVKSAADLVKTPHCHAVSMIERDDFPANIEALSITLGLIFIYYGRRSICEMYATDFGDSIDNTVIAKFIPSETLNALDEFMSGWFDSAKVEAINEFYLEMVITLAKQYGF